MYWEDRVTRAQRDAIELVLHQLSRKRLHPDDAYLGLTANGLTPEEAQEMIASAQGDVELEWGSR